MLKLDELNVKTKLNISKIVKAAEILKTIGHPVRLQIIEALEKNSFPVHTIQKIIEQPQAITSQHLSVLRNKNIVKTNRSGASVYYSIANQFIRNILGCVRNYQDEEYF